MLKNRKIGIIGSGNMGEALISGLVDSRVTSKNNIMCSDISEIQLTLIQKKYGVQTTTNNMEIIETSDYLIYAVKPQIMSSVLNETAPALNMSKLVISIAAGVPLKAIEQCLKKKLRLIRVMPNICAFVRESAIGICAGKHASDEDVVITRTIFDSIGKTVFIADSRLMDAVTALSGSGPGYIFIMIEALADAGVKMGLSRKDAEFLSAQTVLGSAKLMLTSGEHPGQLKDKVASPGGTTISGIHMLEKAGLRAALMDAVEAATKRAGELENIIMNQFTQKNDHK